MGPKVKKTRRSSGDIGAPSELPDVGALYTNKDVIAAINNEVDKSSNIFDSNKSSDEAAALNKVKDAIKKKLHEIIPTVPIIPEKALYVKLKRLHDVSINAKQKKLKAKVFKTFKEKLNRLFDPIVCQCKIEKCEGREACRDPGQCTGYHAICACKKEDKIPDKEVKYVKDQRENVGLLGGNMFSTGQDIEGEKLMEEEAEEQQNKDKKAAKRTLGAQKVEGKINGLHQNTARGNHRHCQTSNSEECLLGRPWGNAVLHDGVSNSLNQTEGHGYHKEA